MTDQFTDRFIRLQASRDRTMTALQLDISLQETHHVFVNYETTRNRLYEVGLYNNYQKRKNRGF